MDDYVRMVRERVGRNVRRLRGREQWTQVELADRIGNDWRTISQIERGKTNVGLDTLARIAHAGSMEVRDLFFNDAPTSEELPGATIVFVSPDDLAAVTGAQAVLTRLTATAHGITETAAALALQGDAPDSDADDGAASDEPE
jgi:transcriptional regulator with XRE-family HTH domain